jgi:mannose-6-phosphate isomerase-like protein (cupin superfamily)
MLRVLTGSCRVTDLREGPPVQEGGLRVWRHVGRESGAEALSLRVLELAACASASLRNAACEEVLFVLQGQGTAILDGSRHALTPEMGLFVKPGALLSLASIGPEPLTLLSSQCPDPGPDVRLEPPCHQALGDAPAVAPVARLWEREARPSGDRWYRVLLDERVGSKQVTQFVGAIPPGRAPDHFHEYEEVLCVLAGEGRMWAGEASTGIGPGSCVFLPRRQVHCTENTGRGELRLLGVFYPAGSPAVSYGAD